jgi:GNAT superfamily N-acetyltransferase
LTTRGGILYTDRRTFPRRPALTSIRRATIADAARLADLSGQLGYPIARGELERTLARLLARDDQVVYVAEVAGTGAVAWIHGVEEELLESGRRCEIYGLVVDRDSRRRGVGRRLLDALERWAAARGLPEITVRSAVSRAESHPFYDRAGYDRVKTQHVYRKRLAAAETSSARSVAQERRDRAP